jgi:hypothetical protein
MWRADVHHAVGKKYVWRDYDCSKFIEEICTDCGILVTRCRAIDYAYGRCNMKSVIIDIAERCECDIAFWDWPNKSGKYGPLDDPDKLDIQHIGIMNSKTSATHNRYGKTIVKSPVKEKNGKKTYHLKHMKRIRRLK